MTRLEWIDRILRSRAPRAVALVRVAVGFVFVTEGIQKFLDPAAFAAGRFARIGIPAPDVMGSFVGVIEIVAGVLVVLGLLTRLAAFALAIDMVVAIVSTKIPILLGHGFLGFAAPSGASGFWPMAHEARVDIAMLFSCAFLFVVGAGPLSLDARISGPSA